MIRRIDINKRISFVCLIGVILAFTVCIRACNEFMSLDMHEHYESYKEAEADGAIKRAWIPEFVPKSATNIKENHNLDVNSEWLTFQFAQVDLEKMKQALKPIKMDEVHFPRGGPSWWPKDLLQASDELVAKHDFYTYLDNVGYTSFRSFIAIEKDQSRAWYWIHR